MTKEETKKCIEVMQAYVDGKEVEYEVPGDNDGVFVNTECPNWCWEECNYRIKEEPKPWDWRGKNIQWVRCTGFKDDQPWKTACVNREGVLVFEHHGDDENSSWPKFKKWEILIYGGFEWSEDNATWRPFI